MERRRFLQLGTGGAAAAAIVTTLGHPALSDSPPPSDLFVHGVASGDPKHHAAVIWTRVTPTPDCLPGSGCGRGVDVTWVVATDPALDRVVATGRHRTSAQTDHTVKVVPRGLRPSTDYFYGFRVGDHRSPVGHFRTAPAPWDDPDGLRFGHVSCSNYAAGYFSAYRHLAAREDLDFVLHVGDYLYEYGDGGYGAFRALQPATEIVTLADYRLRFGLYRSDPDLQALHAAHAMVATIDDHEITNDAWRDGAENHDPSEGNYRARKRAAMKAYFEWMPTLVRPVGYDYQLYRTLPFGSLADLHVMDLRQYRDAQAPDFATSELEDRTMLGRVQENWFANRLSERAPQWQLFANSVQMMQVRYVGFGVDDGEGTARNTDAWDGYRAARVRLLSAVGERTPHSDPVFLTGDIHSSWAADLYLDFDDPTSSPVGTEFVCTSVTSDNLNEIFGAPPRSEASIGFEQAVLAANPHVKLLEFDSHGYSVVDVNRDRARSDWHYISDREDPGATSSFAFSRQTTWGTRRLDDASADSAL